MSHTDTTPIITKPSQVLLVEDDAEIIATVQAGLDADRFSVTSANTLALGRRLLLSEHYHVLLLDLNLPDGNGLSLADELRSAGSQIPIIMLTALSTVQQRVEGFSHGADDYLCKPFSVDELTARLGAVLRRVQPSSRHCLQYSDIVLDLVARELRRDSLRARLSAREVELLAYLIRNQEQTLGRSKILEDVWGQDAEEESNVVNVYINYLRNKMEKDARRRLIHTVRGVGYVLAIDSPEESA